MDELNLSEIEKKLNDVFSSGERLVFCQYLVYAPFAKPDVSQNHLEDTLLYSRQFFADKLSLIAADLHIPMRLRGALSDLYVFFGAGKQKLNAAERKEADKRTNAFIERAPKMKRPLR